MPVLECLESVQRGCQNQKHKLSSIQVLCLSFAYKIDKLVGFQECPSQESYIRDAERMVTHLHRNAVKPPHTLVFYKNIVSQQRLDILIFQPILG